MAHAPGTATASARHLNPAEFVDLLDGVLDPIRGGHLEHCAACRTTSEELAAVAANAAPGQIPDPSPLFWENLSARVRSAMAEEPAPRPSFWAPFTWRPMQAAAMAVAAAAMVVLLLRAGGAPADAPPRNAAPEVALAPAGATGAGEDAFGDLETDEAWALVRSLAEGLDQEEMDGEGVSAGPGSAEHLAARLTEPERLELARLLEEQLKGRVIPESSS